MNNHETIVERSIEREMRDQVCSMDDYRQADHEDRERIEHDMLESISLAREDDQS
jgi:hypothetical protein